MQSPQSGQKSEGNTKQPLASELFVRGQATYRLENWYKDIETLTFRTTVLPLSYDEAEAIRKFRDAEFAYAQQHFGKFQHDDKHYAEMTAAIEAKLSEEHRKIFLAVKARLEPVIQEYVKSSGGAFVKLSTRSPKEAAMVSSRVKELLREQIAASKLKGGTPEANVEDVIFFTRAMGWALKVQSADEAISLFVHSARIFQDLLLFTLDQGKDFSLQLIVREWNNIFPEWEFRLFVTNNLLTACTQYYKTCYVPEIAAKEKQISALIQSYWAEKIRDVPKMREIRDYCIDFAVSPQLDVIKVIEVNNPPPVAGTGLFSWDNAADQQLIREGPFELRVLHSMPPRSRDEIHLPLRVLMNELRGLPTERMESHLRTRCDFCRKAPITPTWYRCHQCGQKDVCEGCKQTHPTDHKFEEIHSADAPAAEEVTAEEAETSGGGCSIM